LFGEATVAEHKVFASGNQDGPSHGSPESYSNMIKREMRLQQCSSQKQELPITFGACDLLK
jgi:hypothetical protein